MLNRHLLDRHSPRCLSGVASTGRAFAKKLRKRHKSRIDRTDSFQAREAEKKRAAVAARDSEPEPEPGPVAEGQEDGGQGRRVPSPPRSDGTPPHHARNVMLRAVCVLQPQIFATNALRTLEAIRGSQACRSSGRAASPPAHPRHSRRRFRRSSGRSRQRLWTPRPRRPRAVSAHSS